MHRPPLLWVVGHIHESAGEHRVPHPAVPDGILLINAASNNLRNGDLNAAPRSVDLPSRQVHAETGPGRGLLGSVAAIWKAVVNDAV